MSLSSWYIQSTLNLRHRIVSVKASMRHLTPALRVYARLALIGCLNINILIKQKILFAPSYA
jgi:hypothetical protein